MTLNNKHLTDQEYWTARQTAAVQQIEGSWIFGKYLEPFMPRCKGSTCLEVGAYPGRHLLFLAEKYGYKVTGIDFSPHLLSLKPIFKFRSIDVTLVQTDFFEWEPEEPFDVVISHGFVEHFQNYQAVINRHWEWVKPNGIMVISVPVLTPFQYFVRLIMYTPEYRHKIFKSHNLGIMQLKKLKKVVAACNSSLILMARYVNWMTIWFGPGSTGVRSWTTPFFIMLRLIEQFARKMDICNGLVSPEILIAVKKIPVRLESGAY